MQLTTEHKESFKTYMTRKVKKTIYTKAKKKGIDISERQIRNILNGTTPDSHGILNIAVKEVSFEKVRRENLQKALNKLK